MKKLRISLLAGTLCLAYSASWASPRSLSSVSDEHIAQLESMHQQAADFLIRNDFKEATRVYLDILLMEPDDETAYTGLGQIYLVQGLSKKAHDAFQNALQIDPRNEVALAGIQSIMDPDGVEGMVVTDETVEVNPPKSMSYAVARVDPGQKELQKSDARLGPVKAKGAARVAGVGRVGKLHAQRVQMALKNAGVYQGLINGMMGKNTQVALRNFQKMRGLEITGTVNTATWNHLVPYLDPGPR